MLPNLILTIISVPFLCVTVFVCNLDEIKKLVTIPADTAETVIMVYFAIAIGMIFKCKIKCDTNQIWIVLFFFFLIKIPAVLLFVALVKYSVYVSIKRDPIYEPIINHNGRVHLYTSPARN